MEAPEEIRILVVDKDNNFMAEILGGHDLLAQKKKGLPVPKFADTIRVAQSLLSDRDYGYVGVFINPSIGSSIWPAVVKCCHEFRPGTPAFVVYDEKPKISKQAASTMGVQGFLPKPMTYERMVELVMDGADLESAEEAPEPPPIESTPAPEKGFTDDDFISVDFSQFHGSSKAIFDLYIKLSNGKFVKIVNIGDVLSKDRIEKYKEKGTTELFVPKKMHADYLAFFDKVVADILKDTSVSVETKASHVSGQGKNALEYFKQVGFSEESLKRAEQYVSNTTEMINQIASQVPTVKNLLNDVVAYEHSVACTTLAGLMLKFIGAQNPVIYNAIGLTCFLHDIALVGQPQVVMDEDESKMTSEQKAIFLAHPDEGAKAVKKMKNVPPVVVTAIEQHHLRMGKKGFPAAKQVDNVNKIAQFVGICEEFVFLMKKAKTDPAMNPFKILSEKAPGRFANDVVGAFTRTFQEK